MYKNKKISVVVPAYNEEMLIEPTLRSIPDNIDKVYAVDDSSPDNTFELIEARAGLSLYLVLNGINPLHTIWGQYRASHEPLTFLQNPPFSKRQT